MFWKRSSASDIPNSRIIIARYRGTCSCGKVWSVGDQIEWDPISKKPSCLSCFQRRQQLSKCNLSEVASDSDHFTEIVERIKRIGGLPSPASDLIDEYWQLFDELQQAPPKHSAAKPFLQSRAKCRTKNIVPYVVRLSRKQLCVHCLRLQDGVIVLMDFSSKSVHCIRCECSHF